MSNSNNSNNEGQASSLLKGLRFIFFILDLDATKDWKPGERDGRSEIAKIEARVEVLENNDKLSEKEEKEL